MLAFLPDPIKNSMIALFGLIAFAVFQSWPAALVAVGCLSYDGFTTYLEHKPDPEHEAFIERLNALEKQIKDHQTIVDTIRLQSPGVPF